MSSKVFNYISERVVDIVHACTSETVFQIHIHTITCTSRISINWWFCWV